MGRFVEDSRDGYVTVTAPKKKAEKRALADLANVRVLIDDEEEKPKRRRFCECDADAIEISEEEE